MRPNGSVPCMESGSDKHSYANNSLLQNFNFHSFAKPRLSQALDHLSHHLTDSLALHYVRRPMQLHGDNGGAADDASPNHVHHAGLHEGHNNGDTWVKADHGSELAWPGSQSSNASEHQPNGTTSLLQLKVADFGCSFGRNTLDYTAHIVQGLQSRLTNWLASSPACHQWTAPAHDGEAPAQLDVEMQYFFSDLPSNNFNSLFQSLQPFLQDIDPMICPLSFRLFMGAAPGSFHHQLFPTGSLDLAISSYSLQWLCQVPPEVVDRASPAWNGGHVWIRGERPEVVKAFAQQFHKDMKSFLLSRAKELKEGGILFLFFPGRAQLNPEGAFFSPNHDIWTGCFEATWEEMVAEGLITKEERDMFNIPFYNCHKMEMQEVLNEVSDKFCVLNMDVVPDCNNLPREEEEKIAQNPQAFGKFVASFVGSVMKPIMQDYLDSSQIDDFFRRLEIQAAKRAHLSTIIAYDMVFAIIQRI